MKKAVSLLVALATALGISAAAFAAEDFTTYAEKSSMMVQPRLSMGTSGVNVQLNELLIGQGSAGTLVLPESQLKPGEDYSFTVYRSTADDTNIAAASVAKVALNETDINGGRLRLRAVKGSSVITSAKVEKKGSGGNSTYVLKITTKETWGTKNTDVEYSLAVIDQTKTPITTFVDGVFSFKVGYGRYTDDEIASFSEGDIITISDDLSVITKSQFETLSKNYNYKNIQFEAEDGSWAYLGKTSGMPDTNFTYTQNVVPSIIQKFEDQDFKFITFGAGVSFPTNGEMRIDVSDVSDDFTKMFTYLYRDGKLTPIKTTYDSGADELVFKTNFLGSFVITNEEITDRTIINQGGGESNSNTDNSNVAPNPTNPNTGTSGMVAVAIALGTVSLGIAGVTIRKRK